MGAGWACGEPAAGGAAPNPGLGTRAAEDGLPGAAALGPGVRSLCGLQERAEGRVSGQPRRAALPVLPHCDGLRTRSSCAGGPEGLVRSGRGEPGDRTGTGPSPLFSPGGSAAARCRPGSPQAGASRLLAAPLSCPSHTRPGAGTAAPGSPAHPPERRGPGAARTSPSSGRGCPALGREPRIIAAAEARAAASPVLLGDWRARRAGRCGLARAAAAPGSLQAKARGSRAGGRRSAARRSWPGSSGAPLRWSPLASLLRAAPGTAGPIPPAGAVRSPGLAVLGEQRLLPGCCGLGARRPRRGARAVPCGHAGLCGREEEAPPGAVSQSGPCRSNGAERSPGWRYALRTGGSSPLCPARTPLRPPRRLGGEGLGALGLALVALSRPLSGSARGARRETEG
ncbi:tektin-5 [Platysternon megacephalum]|uniref:Tektin-5 n=1 Tax=Platysternon megacephalum TaxID=55544 RepID=A0A4D9DSS4_9SAUR|nr:tektin-5 [Platysternon megacephalum]